MARHRKRDRRSRKRDHCHRQVLTPRTKISNPVLGLDTYCLANASYPPFRGWPQGEVIHRYSQRRRGLSAWHARRFEQAQLPNGLRCRVQRGSRWHARRAGNRRRRCTEPGHSVHFRLTETNARIALMGLWNTIRLKSSSPEVRRKALESLDTTRHARALEPLLAGLGDEDAQVRCAAVRGLAQIEGDESVAALVSALHDPSSEVREAAAAALGRLGNARRFPPPRSFVDRLASRRADSRGRRPAQPGLETRHPRGAGHVRSRPRPRSAAAFAGEAAVKALVTELKHDTSFQRRAAAEALENVDDPRATQPLLAALKDADPPSGFRRSMP